MTTDRVVEIYKIEDACKRVQDVIMRELTSFADSYDRSRVVRGIQRFVANLKEYE